MEKGANIYAKDTVHQWTPFHTALCGNFKEIAQIFIQHGAAIDTTAIEVAQRNGGSNSVAFLQNGGKGPEKKKVEKREESAKEIDFTEKDSGGELVNSDLQIAIQKIDKGDYPSAIQSLKESIQKFPYRDPHLIAFNRQLGFCHLAVGKFYLADGPFNEIIRCLENGLKSAACNEAALLNVQLAYYVHFTTSGANGDKSKAYLFEAKLKLKPKEMPPGQLADFYGWAGLVNYNLVRMEKSIKYLEKSLAIFEELEISNESLRVYKDALNRAQVHFSRESSFFKYKLKKQEGFFFFKNQSEGFQFAIQKILAKDTQTDKDTSYGTTVTGMRMKWTNVTKTTNVYTDDGEHSSTTATATKNREWTN